MASILSRPQWVKPQVTYSSEVFFSKFNCFLSHKEFECVDAKWQHKTWSILVQVMACCLTTPSHNLNQCWLITGKVLWHSPEGNFTGSAPDIYPWYEFENYWIEIAAAYPKDWFNPLCPSNAKWRHCNGSTFAQVMACCLMSPSHYLHNCWLIKSKIQ